MGKVSLQTIKNWFKTGLKPTEQQFWSTWDSFFHKDENIPQSKIENLSQRFDQKADAEAFNIYKQKIDAMLNQEPISVNGQQEYVLEWTNQLKAIYGSWAKFQVWQGGSWEKVPVEWELGEDGKPLRYTFTLDGLDTKIFITL